MADEVVKTPYSTAMPYVSASLPDWVDPYDAQRLASYDLYDDMYRNSDQSYALMLRDKDETPIYIPMAKKIINTMARYVGRGWNFSVSSETGTSEQQAAAKDAFGRLFRRERLLSKFASGKKEWLRRGDWVWLITADPEKPEGRRISVTGVDPRTYFPIVSDLDPTRILGVRIIEEYDLEDDEKGVKVQRWLKPSHPEHPNHNEELGENSDELGEEFIAYDSMIYELEDWDDPAKRKRVEVLSDIVPIDGIHNLPVYNIRNNEVSSSVFGTSDLSGIESLISGVNQAISDEDEALSIAGLGMYTTDSGAPIDDNDNPVPWYLGPGQVIEVGDGKKFSRIDGISSVEPIQTHVGYLERNANSTLGVNDVAMGETEGSVQISGVALAIKMQPLFDAADEKDKAISDVMNQLFFDLREWFVVYEGIDLGSEEDEDGGVQIVSSVDKSDRLPFDREARWNELLQGLAAKIFTVSFVISELQEKFGYVFPAEMLEELTKNAELEASQTAALLQDPFASRASDELNTGADDDE